MSLSHQNQIQLFWVWQKVHVNITCTLVNIDLGVSYGLLWQLQYHSSSIGHCRAWLRSIGIDQDLPVPRCIPKGMNRAFHDRTVPPLTRPLAHLASLNVFQQNKSYGSTQVMSRKFWTQLFSLSMTNSSRSHMFNFLKHIPSVLQHTEALGVPYSNCECWCTTITTWHSLILPRGPWYIIIRCTLLCFSRLNIS